MADHGYFTWDPEGDGFTQHGTADAARAHIRAIIEEEAANGWNTDRLWKEVPPGVTIDEDGKGSDGVDYSDIPGCDALVDYELRDA